MIKYSRNIPEGSRFQRLQGNHSESRATLNWDVQLPWGRHRSALHWLVDRGSSRSVQELLLIRDDVFRYISATIQKIHDKTLSWTLVFLTFSRESPLQFLIVTVLFSVSTFGRSSAAVFVWKIKLLSHREQSSRIGTSVWSLNFWFWPGYLYKEASFPSPQMSFLFAESAFGGCFHTGRGVQSFHSSNLLPWRILTPHVVTGHSSRPVSRSYLCALSSDYKHGRTTLPLLSLSPLELFCFVQSELLFQTVSNLWN